MRQLQSLEQHQWEFIEGFSQKLFDKIQSIEKKSEYKNSIFTREEAIFLRRLLNGNNQKILGTKLIYETINYERIIHYCQDYAVKNNDRKAIQQLINVLVTGKAYRQIPGLFSCLLKDKTLNVTALSHMVSGYLNYMRESSCLSTKTFNFFKTQSWSLKNPNKIVNISTGSGAFYLRHFLLGHTKGYDLDGNGRGIFSSVNYNDRDLFYAYRKSPLYGDDPAVLVGCLAAKDLVKTNNGYEVGITANVVGKIDNLNVKILPEKKPDHINLSFHFPTSVNELINYIGIENLKNVLRSKE